MDEEDQPAEIAVIKNTYEVSDMRTVQFDGLAEEAQLIIHLFDGTTHTVDYVRTETFSNGTSAWVGRIENQPFSSIIFAESNGTWSGRMEDDSGNRYLLLPNSDATFYHLVALGDGYIYWRRDKKPKIKKSEI